MTKIQFILELNEKLSGLPRKEVEESLNFYGEMIADRMEEGFTEEEAVAAVGDVNEIAAQITRDIPFLTLAKEKIKPQRRLKTWEIVLLAVGSPIWLSLLIALVSIVFSVYISLWAAVVSIWAIFAAAAGAGVGCLIGGIILLCMGKWLSGCALIGYGFVSVGLGILLFFCSKKLTVGVVKLAGKMVTVAKRTFAKKEVAK